MKAGNSHIRNKYSFGLDHLLSKEEELLKARRIKLFDEESAKTLHEQKIGLALSGDHLTSFALNLGFLKKLNDIDSMKLFDYFSMLSGGGYAGAYVQTGLKHNGNQYSKILHEGELRTIKENTCNEISGQSPERGSGIRRIYFMLNVNLQFLFRLIVYLMSPLIVVSFLVLAYLLIFRSTSIQNFFTEEVITVCYTLSTYGWGLLFLLGFLSTLSNSWSLVNLASTVLIANVTLIAGTLLLDIYKDVEINSIYLVATLIVVFILGFFNSINLFGFSAIHKKLLERITFKNSGNVHKEPLKGYSSTELEAYLGAYPLFNASADIGKGRKSSFIISPVASGMSTVGFAQDHKIKYEDAVFMSATRSNLGAGYSILEKVYSLVLFFFPFRAAGIISKFLNVNFEETPTWYPNPNKVRKFRLIYWPLYYTYSLFSLFSRKNNLLKISDGAESNALGVFELFRRKCKLIICLDSGPDPKYGMQKLGNLVVKSRNELGYIIQFRENSGLERLKPKITEGFSEKRFAIADIYPLWKEEILIDSEGNEIFDRSNKKIKYTLLFGEYLTNEEVKYPEIQIGGDLNNEERIRYKAEIIDRHFKSYVDLALRKNELRISTLVYVKPGAKAPFSKPIPFSPKNMLQSWLQVGYLYKLSHSNFPHEAIPGKYLEEEQWAAYFSLGYQMAEEVFAEGISARSKEGKITHSSLIDFFVEEKPAGSESTSV